MTPLFRTPDWKRGNLLNHCMGKTSIGFESDYSHQDLMFGVNPWSETDCARTVPESMLFIPLGLALSEKQIPRVVENLE